MHRGKGHKLQRDNTKDAQVIHLDVGGEKMITTYGTLVNAFPTSKLAVHFGDRSKVAGITHLSDEKDPLCLSAGTHFIDADPRIFVLVLNLLRRPDLYYSYTTVSLTHGVTKVELLAELRFWDILRDKGQFALYVEHVRKFGREEEEKEKKFPDEYICADEPVVDDSYGSYGDYY